jgi:predicted Zn-dependent peptidase
MPANHLEAVLGIYTDVVRHPHLPDDQLEDARMVCVQELRSIEDDLQQKALQELRWLQYGHPYGRAATGTLASLQALTLDDVQQHFLQFYAPDRAILGVAGKLDWDRLRDRVGTLLGDWQPKPTDLLQEVPCVEQARHLPADSTQTHIAVSYPSVPYSDPRYFEARAAVGVLSDGMSSRLFTEIRENRGLCYSVYASCHSLRDRGCVQCYAGTTTDRAQETLDVLIAELRQLATGVRPDELERLQARIKSALIMQQESSASRSQSIAADWYHLGRVYQLEELRRIVDGLTCEKINAYLSENPPRDFRIVTLGEQPLEHPVGIS